MADCAIAHERRPRVDLVSPAAKGPSVGSSSAREGLLQVVAAREDPGGQVNAEDGQRTCWEWRRLRAARCALALHARAAAAANTATTVSPIHNAAIGASDPANALQGAEKASLEARWYSLGATSPRHGADPKEAVDNIGLSRRGEAQQLELEHINMDIGVILCLADVFQSRPCAQRIPKPLNGLLSSRAFHCNARPVNGVDLQYVAFCSNFLLFRVHPNDLVKALGVQNLNSYPNSGYEVVTLN